METFAFVSAVCGYHVYQAVSVKRRLQTTDCRLQTGSKMQTKGKMQTADCRLQTESKMQTEDKIQY